MPWEQVLGFFTMWPSPGVTVGLWAKAGVPLWQTTSYVLILTSITLSLTYCGVDWLKNWAAGKGIIDRALIERLHDWWRRINSISQTNGFEKRWTKKIKKWLVPQKDWQILPWGFVPFIPVLPTVVFIITDLRGIKH